MLAEAWDANGVVSFDHLRREYGMPITQWLRYNQLRSELQTRISQEEERQEESPLEIRLLSGQIRRKLISQTYGSLMRNTQGDLDKIKRHGRR